jgi:hypothetical protein
MVWCVRNNFIFNNHQENTHTSVAKIHSLVNASGKAFSLPSVVSPLAGHQHSVRWFRPADEFVCLNVDGSFLGSNNTAGYDGLLRNRDGEFIWGFYGVAAIQNILYAEIMAIWYGLKLCWERGFRKVFCSVAEPGPRVRGCRHSNSNDRNHTYCELGFRFKPRWRRQT